MKTLHVLEVKTKDNKYIYTAHLVKRGEIADSSNLVGVYSNLQEAKEYLLRQQAKKA